MQEQASGLSRELSWAMRRAVLLKQACKDAVDKVLEDVGEEERVGFADLERLVVKAKTPDWRLATNCSRFLKTRS